MADILSQDEIDSLLSIIGDDDDDGTTTDSSSTSSKQNSTDSIPKSAESSSNSSITLSTSSLKDEQINKIEYLMDIKLPITVEIGRRKMNIKTLLDLYEGVIFDLQKDASDSVYIKLNNKDIARGEVIVADERFGVRITHLVSPEDRIKALS